MRKLLVAIGTAVAALCAVPAVAGAGGWGVISFDSAPAVSPGESTELGFTFLRHGVTPESSEGITFALRGPDGSTDRFTAVPDGRVGHHVVTIEVAEAGRYMWSVEGASFMPIDLGSLEVAASAGASPSWRWDALQWGGTGLAAVLAGLAVAESLRSRRHRRDASAPAAA